MERKRSPMPDLGGGGEASFATAAVSNSARSSHGFTSRSATLPPHRTESPPASAYFSEFAGDDTLPPQPTPDASSHFAYSTTLRRHHPEGPLAFPQTPHGAALPTFEQLRSVVSEEGTSGLWDKVMGTVRSYVSPETHDYEALPTRREETKDTPSARFAHCSIEVRDHSSTLFKLLIIVTGNYRLLWHFVHGWPHFLCYSVSFSVPWVQ